MKIKAGDIVWAPDEAQYGVYMVVRKISYVEAPEKDQESCLSKGEIYWQVLDQHGEYDYIKIPSFDNDELLHEHGWEMITSSPSRQE